MKTLGSSINEENIGLRILSKEQIKSLNKDGYNLNEKSLYVLKFLLNDKPNESADPISYQIDTSAVNLIAKTAIGRPYVFNPGIINNIGAHIRGKIDDPQKIIQFQKKFAIGEMENYIVNPNSKNAYAIIRVFPEYEDAVLSGAIPIPTSHLLEPLKWKDGKVVDGRILHLQAVKNAGYGDIASVSGACIGMLDKCMSELRTLGSSGKLKNFQRKFSYSESTLGSALSDPNPNGENSTPSLESVAKDVEGLKQTYQSLSARVDSIGTMTQAIAQKMGIEAGGEGEKKDKPPTVGSSKLGEIQIPAELKDHPFVKELVTNVSSTKTELAKIVEERTKEKEVLAKKEKKLAEEKRLEQAKIIAQGEIKLKKFPEDKLQERIKFYTDLKDVETEELKDLSLLADTYKELVPSTLGSAADFYSIDEYPELHTDIKSSNMLGMRKML